MVPADPPSARVAPPPILAAPAPAAVLAALPGARAVGGCVRDALAGRPVADVDVAVPLPPEEAARRLRAAGLRVAETGLAHGTVTAVLGGQPVEVTSLRRDLETDGRHALVAWTEDWREDAARRDFTINAMSLSAAGELWDYFGGREDLAAGRVRFVGEPSTRLAEDYLRALRFFRFQARYGRGAPDAAALAAIRAAVPGLARLSAERVWSELKRLLAAPEPVEALALMEGCGVLGAVLPEARAARLPVLRRLIEAGAGPEPLLRLAALLDPATDARALAARLRLSNEEAARLAALLEREGVPAPDAPDPARALRVWRAGLPAGGDAEASLRLAEAERGGAGWDALREAAARQPAPVFPLLGRDVLAAGGAPGPETGRLLRDVRDWWLAGGAVAGREACLARLAAMMNGIS